MQTAHKLCIEVQEWPCRGDLEEYLNTNNSRSKILNFLSREFDTEISFRAGDLELLSGYPESFILPLHSFAMQLSQGLKTLDQEGIVQVPIYLQQYKIDEGDPAHIMEWEREENQIMIRFQWCNTSSVPKSLVDLGEVIVDCHQFREEILAFLDTYTRKIAMLLGFHANWTGEEISTLFEQF